MIATSPLCCRAATSISASCRACCYAPSLDRAGSSALAVEVPDRPGVLAEVAQVIGDLRGNIVDVTHRRDLPGVTLKQALLEVSVETRDQPHADAIVTALARAGYPVVT